MAEVIDIEKLEIDNDKALQLAIEERGVEYLAGLINQMREILKKEPTGWFLQEFDTALQQKQAYIANKEYFDLAIYKLVG